MTIHTLLSLTQVRARKLEKMLDDVTQWERPFTPNQVDHPPSTPSTRW